MIGEHQKHPVETRGRQAERIRLAVESRHIGQAVVLQALLELLAHETQVGRVVVQKNPALRPHDLRDQLGVIPRAPEDVRNDHPGLHVRERQHFLWMIQGIALEVRVRAPRRGKIRCGACQRR